MPMWPATRCASPRRLAGTVVEVFARNTSRVDGRPGTAAARSHRRAAGAGSRRRRAGPDRAPGAASSRHSPDSSMRWSPRAGSNCERAEQDLARREPLLGRTGRCRRGSAPCPRRRGPRTRAARRRRVSRRAPHARWSTRRPLTDNPGRAGRSARRYRDAWIALQRTAIVAPVDGFVAQRSVQLGQRIAPGEPLMTRDSAAGRVARRELQGRPAAPPAHRTAGARSSATCTAAIGGVPRPGDRAVRPAPAPPSRCCRRRMPRATGSRSCSACR